MDAHGRTIDYLRLSVTDRCNERCLYCMPEGYRGWEQQADHLTATEIVRVVRVAAGLGFRKFRLTGGEPLVRPDVPEIVRAMAGLPGVDSVALSTNGTRLARLAVALRAAGLRSVNVSLDALDPQTYRRITGGNVEAVLAGLRAARAAGFERVKLNCVLMRGLNDHEIWPLVRFAADQNLPIRLIEMMPVTTTEVLSRRNFFPIGEARALLAEQDELLPEASAGWGWGPATYFRLRRTGALVGFIGAVTNLHFCEACNKMRLTADGRIRPCLGSHGEFDLRTILRTTSSDDAVRAVFASALEHKPREHDFRQQYRPCRPMTAIGG